MNNLLFATMCKFNPWHTQQISITTVIGAKHNTWHTYDENVGQKNIANTKGKDRACTSQGVFQVEALLLISHENTPPGLWPLGHVGKFHRRHHVWSTNLHIYQHLQKCKPQQQVLHTDYLKSVENDDGRH